VRRTLRAVDLPALVFGVVFEHEEGGVLGDDGEGLAEANDFSRDPALPSPSPLRRSMRLLRPHALDLRVCRRLRGNDDLPGPGALAALHGAVDGDGGLASATA
jgi:hypothetical protein